MESAFFDPEKCLNISKEQLRDITCFCSSVAYPPYVCIQCAYFQCKSCYYAYRAQYPEKPCMKCNVDIDFTQALSQESLVYRLYKEMCFVCEGCKKPQSIFQFKDHQNKCDAKVPDIHSEQRLTWITNWPDRDPIDPIFSEGDTTLTFEATTPELENDKYFARSLHTKRGFTHGKNKWKIVIGEYLLNFQVGVVTSTDDFEYEMSWIDLRPEGGFIFFDRVELYPSHEKPHIGSYCLNLELDMDQGELVCDFNEKRYEKKSNLLKKGEIFPAITFNGEAVFTIVGPYASQNQ